MGLKHVIPLQQAITSCHVASSALNDDDPCSFLKKVQKKSAEFKELQHNHCKPLSAILTIPELNLLCVFPLVL